MELTVTTLKRDEKWCRRCCTDKPLDDFGDDRRMRDGKKTYCRACHAAIQRESEAGKRWREANKHRHAAYTAAYRSRNPRRVRLADGLRKYGLTVEQYDAMSDVQGHLCLICDGPPKRFGRLCVDHDHETGSVRGLLCHKCNAAIGNLNDDPGLLRRAISYLEERR